MKILSKKKKKIPNKNWYKIKNKYQINMAYV